MRYIQRTDYRYQSELDQEKSRYLLELDSYFGKIKYVRPPKYKGNYFKELKPYLIEEFHSKCAYCESIVTEELSTIDHFRPAGGARRHNGQVENAYYVWLSLDWDNLYLACRSCTVRKANNFPVHRSGEIMSSLSQLNLTEIPYILDPCYLDPSQSIKLIRSGKLVSNNDFGKYTIEILALNRADLVSKRRGVIEKLISKIKKFDNRDNKAWEVIDQIRQALSIKGEFSGLLNVYFENSTSIPRSVKENLFASLELHRTPQNVIERTTSFISVNNPELDNFLKHRELGQFLPISKIEISGFKGIKYFTTRINLLEGKGSCHAFLGTNGLGKTTILQAITLGLLGVKRLEKLNTQSLKRFGLNSSSIIHEEFNRAKITIYFFDDECRNELVIGDNGLFPHSRDDVALKRTKSGNTDKETSQIKFTGSTGFEPCVLSYGAFRLPAKSRLKDSFSNATGFRVQSMFNDSARINGVQGIFSKHKLRSSLIAIADILQSILGSEGILFEVSLNDKLVIKKRAVNDNYENINFNHLSSGYQAIVTIICDILDVLLSIEQDGISALQSTQAFVLIDELDAHLHPSWRLKILQSFRDAFPLIHFYISTHDPLILRSLSEGELLILRQVEGNKLIAVDDYPALKGASIDQLLTSDMFGLQTTQDIATENVLQDYYNELERVANESSRGDLSEVLENITTPEELEVISNTGLTKRERMLIRLIDLDIAEHKNDPSYSEWSKESVESVFEKAKSLGMIDDL